MPVNTNGALKVQALLSAFPDVTVATPINQGATDAFGEGVCRGVVQGYIGSYLDSNQLHNPALLQNYREKLGSMHVGNNASQFLAMQGDWKHHAGNLASTANLVKAMSLGRSTAGTVQNMDADPKTLFSNLAQSFVADGVYAEGPRGLPRETPPGVPVPRPEHGRVRVEQLRLPSGIHGELLRPGDQGLGNRRPGGFHDSLPGVTAEGWMRKARETRGSRPARGWLRRRRSPPPVPRFG
jgi:hypothetical protein